jgi:primosomal protein N' (replication factor Y)
MNHRIAVLVHTPAYSQIGSALSYASEQLWPAGTLVRVPLGRREVLGVVWTDEADDSDAPELQTDKLRPVGSALQALPPLNTEWRALIGFAARYYQRSAGEVALSALPPQLRELSPVQLERRLNKLSPASAPAYEAAASGPAAVTLTDEQQAVLNSIQSETGPFLLFGATGSGKTEVFMRCTELALQADPQAQVLVMVPEINLTPQLEERFNARFAQRYGAQAVVSMHSGMTPAQRLKSWLAAHSGHARIVLGTRMAVFASMPRLRLIVVDEEHDPSYKSQEGARYSARDLALYRGQQAGAKVILGSATPSLESWHHSRPASEGGRYVRLSMPSRVGAASGQGLPLVRRVDMNHQPKGCVLAPPLIQAITERIARGEQSLIFLNRRGYAPVLQCSDCDWKSQCPHCSAYRVFHKIDRTLKCHHCSLSERVPRACPDCGNPDIAPLGRGTERLEENLAHLLAAVRRPDGQAVQIARIDADTTRLKGTLQAQLAQVHRGDVDVLVGTQMVAKGHDFRRITLVAAINPDGALFSSDFRAPERLFSLLMQASGRAGRDATLGAGSEMWLQTMYPTHPLYEALKRHDYPAFAQSQLLERQQAGMPPWSFQALVRAEAKTQTIAQAFLRIASQDGQALLADQTGWQDLSLYPPVPMSIQRIANVERTQMLIECPSRIVLQRFLAAWQASLHAAAQHPECKGLIRWAIDVDPLVI